jgi:hypothetical protein
MLALSDLIDSLRDLDPRGTIYFRPEEGTPTGNEEAIVAVPGVDGWPDDGRTRWNGWEYLLELNIAEEILAEWADVTGERDLPPSEKLRLILYYAANDAMPPLPGEENEEYRISHPLNPPNPFQKKPPCHMRAYVLKSGRKQVYALQANGDVPLKF